MIEVHICQALMHTLKHARIHTSIFICNNALKPFLYFRSGMALYGCIMNQTVQFNYKNMSGTFLFKIFIIKESLILFNDMPSIDFQLMRSLCSMFFYYSKAFLSMQLCNLMRVWCKKKNCQIAV